jgi:hypothetical protein
MRIAKNISTFLWTIQFKNCQDAFRGVANGDKDETRWLEHTEHTLAGTPITGCATVGSAREDGHRGGGDVVVAGRGSTTADLTAPSRRR